MPDSTNILVALARENNRDYIMPEDLDPLPGDLNDVVRDFLQIIGNQTGIYAEDKGLCAFILWQKLKGREP